MPTLQQKLSARALSRLLAALLTWSALPRDVSAEQSLSTRVRVGAGLTQRNIHGARNDGALELSLGPAPAVALGLDATYQYDALRLGLGLDYRSSVAARVADTAAGPGASNSRTAVRSHSFAAGLRANLQLAASERSARLGLFAGYSVRAFASVAQLLVPRFSLHGPLLRPELELPLFATGLRLELAVEAQWIVGISRALRDQLGPVSTAFAFGGEARLLWPLTEQVTLSLDYRESQALAWPQRPAAQSYIDVERCLLLEAAYLLR